MTADVAASSELSFRLGQMSALDSRLSLQTWDTDPSQWVCLWGSDRGCGAQGFGKTPGEAVEAAWHDERMRSVRERAGTT